MKKLIALACVLAAGCAQPQTAGGPLTFAVMADVQYADQDPGSSRRDYRGMLAVLQSCLEEAGRREAAFVVHLGDIIEGYKGDRERSASDLRAIAAVFRKSPVPVRHVIGNHCLNAGRDALTSELGLESPWYEFAAGGWRFVVLDSVRGACGRFGKEQLAWLEDVLKQAAERGERVLVFSHVPLLKEAAGPGYSAKDPDEALEIIEKSGCVVAYFAGHDHKGGYAAHNGIHHVTLKGMVEHAKTPSFALVTLEPGLIRIDGIGLESDRELRQSVPKAIDY